jgi:hypothetical protein
MRSRIIVSCAIALLTVAQTRGQIPLGTGFVYQGRLNQSGNPVNGTVNLDFTLWNDPTAAGPGNQIGSTQSLAGVTVSTGLFTVTLNAGGEFGATPFNGSKRWLGIRVNGTQLSGRQECTAAPNALFAANADQLDGLNSTAFLQSVPVPLSLSGTSVTNIIRGENTSTFGGATAVRGVASAAAGSTYAGQFDNSSTSGTGVFGRATAATGTTYGVYGHSNSTAGTGVTGSVSASTGTTYGVHGNSASTSGRGVYGLATAATGATHGVYGQSDSSGGGRGVTGIGVTGVYGETTALIGSGVYGYSSGGAPSVAGDGAPPGLIISAPTGVHGRSDSTSGIGVFAEANGLSGTTYGVYAQAVSASGTGVYGNAFAPSGVTYGVYGKSDSPDGYGVYSAGELGASGAKSFRIDHPDDPENKYLLHYSAESPEVINFYSGTATLDSAGEAVIELPRYFAKINKDPRYMLTAVGAPMPMLHVAREIDPAGLDAGARSEAGKPAPVCSFLIAGGVAGKRVSWEVKAVRNDRQTRSHAARVEVTKIGRERGKYQHPELYNQPLEKGVHYR